MLPKFSTQPLELVVSAIHCLREKNGSSPQTILRFLTGKYNVDTELLKLHVQTGLKRGISCGIIRQQSGLYRLNELFSKPILSKPPRSQKRGKPLKKGKLKHIVGKRIRKRLFRPLTYISQKNKRKEKKNKKKGKKLRGNARQSPNEMKWRKQRRGKAKRQRVKSKVKKQKAIPTIKLESNENNINKNNESPKCVTAIEAATGNAVSKT